MKYFLNFLFIGVLLLQSMEPEAAINYRIVWKENFTESEKTKVESWLSTCTQAVSTCLGDYPFEVTYYMHRRENASEPVPWANTIRNGEQGVEFYIDPTFDLKDFLDDWTAPHEIAHLSIPYVGKENMWFSEGYASYMQYLIMVEMDVLEQDEAEERMQERMNKIVGKYNTTEDVVSVNRALIAKHNYPAAYWGGACYFAHVNKALMTEKGVSLMQVIQGYQSSNRLSDASLEEVISSLDIQSGTRLFRKWYELFLNAPSKDLINRKSIQ
ncbi:MAG: hypothetical protein KC456_04520 [Flavobacteriales bacterium]|nr:hypothetical protein [Flavobacteriales bacterium]